MSHRGPCTPGCSHSTSAPANAVTLSQDQYFRTEATLAAGGKYIELRSHDLDQGTVDPPLPLAPDELQKLVTFARQHGWTVEADRAAATSLDIVKLEQLARNCLIDDDTRQSSQWDESAAKDHADELDSLAREALGLPPTSSEEE